MNLHCLVPAMMISMTMTSAAPGQDAANTLHALFAERYAWQMEQSPETAMSHGDYSHADRLTDRSLAAIEKRAETTRSHLDRLRAISRTDLSADDQLNYDLFKLDMENAIEEHGHRTFLAPIGGRFGPQQGIPQMADRVRFASGLDYENYLKRLVAVPKMVDQLMELLRAGLKEKRTPPQVTLQGVPDQFKALLEPDGLKALAEPLDRMPATMLQQERESVRREFDSIAMPAVRNAVKKLAEFFNTVYLPGCRKTIAAIDWPDGEAFYAFCLRQETTTSMTASAIHELGLREVARIRREMMDVIRASDFLKNNPSAAKANEEELFKAFIQYLRTDSRFYHQSAAELMTGYRDICKRVDAQLPRFFKTLPRLPYGVKEIPAFMAPQQTTAYYQDGDIRNAQPGYFMVNTYALNQRPRYEMIPLAIHEAVPGHHLQIALAKELENVPEFRKEMGFNAYLEGWALYSERLGIEMGLYEDPYDNFGRLLYEMWRACRLVVDPGMHSLGWSRDKAVRFMLDNTALSELNINTEIDRYIAWPGQACAYKIGELRIRDLRSKAEAALGRRFDLRDFHDVVLGAGAVPLDVLEWRVNDWMRK